MALPSTPPRKPPPCHPHRQAEQRRVDGDRKRPEQPRHKRRRYRDRAKPDAGHPGGAAIAKPPQPPATERQGQAAGRDKNQRSRRHQQSDRPHAGSGRCCRIRHQAHRRGRHHSGRQPQERQRPKSAVPVVFPDGHAAQKRGRRRSASFYAINQPANPFMLDRNQDGVVGECSQVTGYQPVD